MARGAKVIPFPLHRRATPPTPGFVEVHRCRGQSEALVVRGLLESEGIRVVLRSKIAHSVHPFSVGDQGEVVVLAPERDAVRARAVLSR
jgi:hypothetical protein